MRSIVLKGTPKEIGLQHGRAFKDDIQEFYDFYCCRIAQRTPDQLDPSVLRYLKRRTPYLLEEMEGIAKGAGLSFDETLVYNHFNAMSECTPVFFQETEAGPMLGNNIDCGEEERKAMLVRTVHPSSGHAFITTTFVGCVWSTNGLNAAGFCHGNVFTGHHGMTSRDGTATGIVKRDMVQQSASVDEALEVARSHRQIGKIGIWILADASGKALKLEQTNDEAHTFEPREGLLFSTGIYESPIPSALIPRKLEMGRARLATIERLREASKIEFSQEGMRRLLSHHCSPGPVCRHEPYEVNKDQTHSSRIMIPRSRRYLITDGPPCTAEFQSHRL